MSYTIDRYINKRPTIKVFDLELEQNQYYIKREKIVKKISFDNRTFYSKFELIHEPLSAILFKQHLSKHITMASQLIKDNKTKYLVIKYNGKHPKQFSYLCQHILDNDYNYAYYMYGSNIDKNIQVYIDVNQMTLSQAEQILEQVSRKIELRIPKEWKCLPSSKLPHEYNITTLPYGKITL